MLQQQKRLDMANFLMCCIDQIVFLTLLMLLFVCFFLCPRTLWCLGFREAMATASVEIELTPRNTLSCCFIFLLVSYY